MMRVLAVLLACSLPIYAQSDDDSSRKERKPAAPLLKSIPVLGSLMKRTQEEPTIQVYQLKHARSLELRGVVKPFIEGQVTADPRTNSLIVLAAKAKHPAINTLIEKLDTVLEPAKKVAPQVLRIYSLKNARSSEFLATARPFVQGTIQEDRRTNSIILLATESVHERVKTLVERLDVARKEK